MRMTIDHIAIRSKLVETCGRTQNTAFQIAFRRSSDQLLNMRSLCFSVVSMGLLLHTALAGKLDLAVLQFSDSKSVEQLNAALADQKLAEVTNAGRTRTPEKDLQGGEVIFAQTIPLARGSSFNTSTRLNNQRVDVQGLLGEGSLEVSIELVEGLKAMLSSFQSRIYKGSASLPSGQPRVISMKQTRGKAPSVVKGQTKMQTYDLTTVLIAQYTP